MFCSHRLEALSPGVTEFAKYCRLRGETRKLERQNRVIESEVLLKIRFKAIPSPARFAS